ncbi:PfkB family carbohydrate kinase [Thalassobacillus sp. C254]|uniref:PfkB family carbohydrate kinase n=1 Tax=Thalassobacillus sp. C254 TaxID=1225341 RepID=UPI0006CFA94A|nr:PfkB family carbohydrate kinase [Thalassobacillus sp. C254]
MTNHLLVIGTINMDLVAKVPGFPRPGETIASNYYVESLGGKAANQAIAAKRSGAEVSFIGKVGGDSFGREAYKQLIEEGINVEYLMQSDKKSTGTSLIVVNEDGENMIITNLQANTDLSINEVEHSLLALENVEAALLQLEMSSEMISTIIATLKKRQIPIFVNLAPVIPISLETQSLIDVLILNEVEASQLSGIHVHDKKRLNNPLF